MLKFLPAGVAGVAAALALGSAAQAATIWTFTGSSAADGPVDAQAVITEALGSLTIDLTSFLANPTSIGQEVSGIRLTLDESPLTTVLFSASGTEINIAPGGGTSGDDNVIGHWGTTLNGGFVYLATAGLGAAGGQPFDLIIGPGPYTNANPSITGKNPQIDQTGHFVLNLTGLTHVPVVTGVELAFGTSGTDYHQATCTSGCDGGGGGQGVPEPATWAMMIAGFGGVGAVLRRRRSAFA